MGLRFNKLLALQYKNHQAQTQCETEQKKKEKKAGTHSI